MNSAQRQRILDAIVAYQKADFDTPFQKKYKETDTNTVDTVLVGEYTIAELFAESRKAIDLLNAFLETGNWKVLPSDNVPLSSYGSFSLSSNIANIRNYFASASYEQAAQYVKALVYFEMHCGIWTQNKRGRTSTNKSLVDLEEKLKLSLLHAKEREKKVDALIKDLDAKKTETENLIRTKKQELEALKTNQTDSTTILSNIRNIEANANSFLKTIKESNDKAKDIIDKLEKSQNLVDGQISTSQNDILATKKSLDAFNEEANTKISKITLDYNQVSTYAEEVRKLMHFINDGSLAHSFNMRKTAIQSAVTRWGRLSIGGCLALGAWIWFVFAYLQTNLAEGTQFTDTGIIIFANLIINIGKTSPMIVLLWFILAQYKKERHLLEEYAYREAVAATLTSYLDQLEGENDKNKCALLLSTVEKLYTKPITINEKWCSNLFKQNSIKEATKTITDIVRAINNPQNNKL